MTKENAMTTRAKLVPCSYCGSGVGEDCRVKFKSATQTGLWGRFQRWLDSGGHPIHLFRIHEAAVANPTPEATP